MQIPLKVPVRARAVNAQNEQVTVFGVEIAPFEFKEADPDEIPVVISFSTDGTAAKTRRYRRDPETGQMYRFSASVAAAASKSELGQYVDTVGAYSHLRQVNTSTWYAMTDRGRPVVPFGNARTSELDESIRTRDVGNIREQDVAECVAAYQTTLDTYRIVDGAVWEPCVEPSLRLQRGKDGWAIHLSSNDIARDFAADWNTYYFSVDELDQAHALMDVLAEAVAPRPMVRARMELSPDFVPGVSGDRLDLVALADKVLRKVAWASDNLMSQPSDIIADCAVLKRVIEADPAALADGDLDLAARTITSLVDAEADGRLVRSKEYGKGRDYTLARLGQAIELHLRRWDERRIAVDPAVLHMPRP